MIKTIKSLALAIAILGTSYFIPVGARDLGNEKCLQKSTITKASTNITGVDISNDTGDIKIRKSQNLSDFRITTAKIVESNTKYDSQELLKNFIVKINTVDNKLLISAHVNKKSNLNISSYLNLRTDIIVEIPAKSYDYSLKSDTGDISIRNVNGAFKLSTDTGDVKLRNSTGNYNLDVDTGDIIGSNVKGSFQVNEDTGDINLKNVEFVKNSELDCDTGDISLYIKSLKNTNNLNINVDTGDIKLFLPKKSQFSLDTKTGDAQTKHKIVNGGGNTQINATSEMGEVQVDS